MTLSEYLKKKRLTETEFADLIGVSQAAVNRYCRGRVPASGPLREIIRVTNGAVSANSFFEKPSKIVVGMREAVAYARGDKSKGRAVKAKPGAAK